MPRLAYRATAPVCTHFIGFKDDRYHAAVRIWGKPHFIHRGWDIRAQRDIGVGDVVIFAEGNSDRSPYPVAFSDINEDYL